jgi:hypothetical protein
MRSSPPACGAWRIITASATTSTPGSEHAEATLQWQSQALWLMWEAVFGVALWHSGDSRLRRAIELSHANLNKSNLNKSNVTEHVLKNAGREKNNEKNLNEHVKPLKNASDPKNFSERRDFAKKTAFNSFWHDKWHQDWWHHHHFFHIGWIGPWFWPYAYGDFFYLALWPWDYWYYDPFWAYGYGDIYQAVFSPYSYDDYVQGPRAPERMARLKQSMAQGCNEEAGEVTGWPIDQIQAAVQPDQHQSQLLDGLGNAVVKASDEIRAHCLTDIAFTPTARLDHMRDRLQALVNAVNIVSPTLSSFYDSLSDEQKARFNGIAPRTPRRGQAAQGDLTASAIRGQCDAGTTAWPTDQIDRVVRPDDAQRAKLQSLQSAAHEPPTRSKPLVRPTFHRRRRRGWRQSGSGWKPCCKASRRCSRRWPTSTIRSATIRRPASTRWAGNCRRRMPGTNSAVIAKSHVSRTWCSVQYALRA